MSAAVTEGPPEAKKFRIDLPTQASVSLSICLLYTGKIVCNYGRRPLHSLTPHKTDKLKKVVLGELVHDAH